MNLLALILQHETAAEPNVFAFTGNVSFWTIIIFLLLLFVLKKYAFPPILGYAAAREQRIQETLDAARKEREEAERMIQEQHQEMVRTREQAQQIIADAQKTAERIRKETLEKARGEQEDLITRAKSEIEAEKLRAIDSLRREAVDLAIAAASKLVERTLDTAEDRRIVTEFLANVDRGEVAATR